MEFLFPENKELGQTLVSYWDFHGRKGRARLTVPTTLTQHNRIMAGGVWASVVVFHQVVASAKPNAALGSLLKQWSPWFLRALV